MDDRGEPDDAYEVLARGLDFPEGPAFAPDGSLWGVEMLGGRLFRWSRAGLSRVDVGGRPNGLVCHGDQILFCDAGADSVRALLSSAASCSTRTIAESQPARALTAPNDLAFDGSGNLVFTCPGDSRAAPTGTVWVRSLGGHLAMIAGDLFFPNGLVFSPDGRDLIIAETFRQRLWRGGWDALAGRWISPRPWADLPGPIGPDGMAFGPDGRLYVAHYGASAIRVFNDAGEMVSSLSVPGAKPTNVAFDPNGLLGLVVTEAEQGLLLSYPGVGHVPTGRA